MSSFKIILSDDHKMFRDGIRALLEKHQDLELVAEAKNMSTLDIAMSKNQTDLLILDISYERGEELGFEIALKIRLEYPDVKILVITFHDDFRSISKMRKIGVEGYILKDDGYQELTKAIDIIRQGGTYFSQTVKNIFFDKMNQEEQALLLTPREKEVLKLITNGLTSKETGKELSIAKLTVDHHRKNLIEKTGCKNVKELIRWGLENGFG